MKKIFAVLMMIAMLAALPFAAMAEEPEMDTLLEGLVTESGFMLDDIDRGEVMINTSELTVWDGVLAEGELAEGQYVFVNYDGRMTFSLPPQAHADRVVCAVLTGSVSEVLEDGSILMVDDTFGDVIVHLPEGMIHVYAGMPITVYYDGVMTLSLPGQAAASHIILPELSGTVSNLTEEGFTLTDEYGMEYEVKFDENTLISEEIVPVEEETAEEELTEESAGAEVTEAVTEETAEETAEEAAEETESGEEMALEDGALTEETAPAAELLSESAIEWADGDNVTVYYNGMMTRSIPAQVTAMEVVVIR